MRKTLFETNFDRVVQLGIFDVEGKNVDYKKSIASGFMDFVVERMPHYDDVTNNSDGQAYSLTHWFKQNGDLCKDPDMVIIVYPNLKMVEALTFEQSIPPIFQEVYLPDGRYYPGVKKELNSFLRQWLINLTQQGHGKSWLSQS